VAKGATADYVVGLSLAAEERAVVGRQGLSLKITDADGVSFTIQE